jgi:hypothetical protein
MPDIPIAVASGDYDRIRAIKDGSVRIAGCIVDYHVVEPNQLFARNLKSQEFDVSEMSFSTYIALREQGLAHYTAIPVFLSRAFRHSAIFVRTDPGMASPADLKGKRVGTPEYFTTMLVWMRGLLADEYGIKPQDLRWRLGGLEQPAGNAAKVEAPTGVDIEPIPSGKTLAGMLADGEIDAVFSARPPSCFTPSPSPAQPEAEGAKVARLFPDYRAAEQAYYRKTGIYAYGRHSQQPARAASLDGSECIQCFRRGERDGGQGFREALRPGADFAMDRGGISGDPSRARQRYLALRHRCEPHGDRHAVPLPARTGLYPAAYGHRGTVRAGRGMNQIRRRGHRRSAIASG